MRGSSAPPDLALPIPPVGNLVMANVQEPDIDRVSSSDARLLIQGLNPRLIRLLYVGFRFCRTRGQIAETLELGQLHADDLREAVVAAMVRGWRLDTLILLVVKSNQL